MALTRKYIRDHIANPAGAGEGFEAESAEAFANALLDRVLFEAEATLEDEEVERDEIEISLPFTVRAVSQPDQPMGCIEVCYKAGGVTVCYHKGFKGKVPGL